MKGYRLIRTIVMVVLCSIFSMEIWAQEAEDSGSSVSYITVYKEEGFRGESEKFLIGTYNKLTGGWKDEIKSIALIGAVRVTLFDKEKLEGKKLVVEQNMYKLEDFEEKTASMLVEPFSCQYAIAYKDTIYRGNSKQFQVDRYAELRDGWDDMESMELCGNVTVTLFKKKNFEGESITINKDRIDLGEFRKDVESMIVEAAPGSTN